MVSWLIEFYFISRWDILTEILEAQKQRAARQGIDMEKVHLSHKFDLKEGKYYLIISLFTEIRFFGFGKFVERNLNEVLKNLGHVS